MTECPSQGPAGARWVRPLRKELPTLLIASSIAVGMLAAFVHWTLPVWSLFLETLPRFSVLWQIPLYRRTLLVLLIQIGSPLLIGFQLGGSIWLCFQFAPMWRLVQERLAGTMGGPAQPWRIFFPARLWRPAPEKPTQAAAASSPILEPLAGERLTPQHMPSASLWPSPSDATQERAEAEPSSHLPASQELHSVSVSQTLLPGEPATHVPSTSAVIPLEAIGDTVQQEPALVAATHPLLQPSLLPAHNGETRPYEVVITLLKKVSITVVTAQGLSRPVPLTPNAKRIQLLAYVAWHSVQGERGHRAQRDRMLERVFGHGREDEQATREKLGEEFDSHKKFLRRDLRKVIAQINAEIGEERIPAHLDLFAQENGLYRLSPVCRVVDLEAVEEPSRVIEAAQNEGLLIDEVPPSVKDACDRLIAAYRGDFLQELVTEYFDDLDSWHSCWIRTPYTRLRDAYLHSLWYAAEYEQQRGQVLGDAGQHTEQRQHWGAAAQHFRTYAMYACNHRFDSKVLFGRGRHEYGERVVMSERALRRCLVLYGASGQTHLVDQVYQAYSRQMRSVSGKVWEPSPETLADLEAAKQQTSAYRFPKELFPRELQSEEPS